MVKTCCVSRCNNKDTNDELQFFKIPTKKDQKTKWLEILKSKKRIMATSVVCSEHFKSEDFELKLKKRVLREDAVPSVFFFEQKATRSNRRLAESSEKQKDDAAIKKSSSVKKKTPKNKDIQEVKQDKLDESSNHESIDSENEIDSTTNVQKTDERTDSNEKDNSEKPKPDFPDENTKENLDINTESTDSHTNNTKSVDSHTETVESVNQTESAVKITESGITVPELVNNIDLESYISTHSIEAKSGQVDIHLPKLKMSDSLLEDIENTIKGDVILKSVINGMGVNQSVYDDQSQDTDCMMLVENVQVDLDPSEFLLQESYEDEPDPPMETVEIEDDKPEEPVSLLTSSDEDDVIIQEPKYDMIEVSSGSDDSDIPLKRLLKPNPENPKIKLKKIETVYWNSKEYICMSCKYSTNSKSKFFRHKAIHKGDKKYKCQYCEYRAKHKMSVVYHTKVHLKERKSKSKRKKKVSSSESSSDY